MAACGEQPGAEARKVGIRPLTGEAFSNSRSPSSQAAYSASQEAGLFFSITLLLQSCGEPGEPTESFRLSSDS